MIIKKNLPLCCLEVDSKNGNIWLNSTTCVLRISGIEFKTSVEKFSNIDISDNKAYMSKGESSNENDEALNNFLISVTQLLYSSQILKRTTSKQKQFYKKLKDSIKSSIETQEIL